MLSSSQNILGLNHIKNSPNPFGMLMSSRSFSIQTKYRYGFNGKELDSDIASDNYDFGARIYDARIGRWYSFDRHFFKSPGISPYRFSFNSPISFFDPDGNYEIDASLTIKQKSDVKMKAKEIRNNQRKNGEKVEKLREIRKRLTQETEAQNKEKIETAIQNGKKLLDNNSTAKEVFQSLTGSNENGTTVEKQRYNEFFTNTGTGPKIGMKDIETSGETLPSGEISLNPNKLDLSRTILHEYIHFADKMGYIKGDGTYAGYSNLKINGTEITSDVQREAIIKAHDNLVKQTDVNTGNRFIIVYKSFIEITNNKMTGKLVEGGYLFEILSFNNIYYEKPTSK